MDAGSEAQLERLLGELAPSPADDFTQLAPKHVSKRVTKQSSDRDGGDRYEHGDCEAHARNEDSSAYTVPLLLAVDDAGDCLQLDGNNADTHAQVRRTRKRDAQVRCSREQANSTSATKSCSVKQRGLSPWAMDISSMVSGKMEFYGDGNGMKDTCSLVSASILCVLTVIKWFALAPLLYVVHASPSTCAQASSGGTCLAAHAFDVDVGSGHRAQGTLYITEKGRRKVGTLKMHIGGALTNVATDDVLPDWLDFFEGALKLMPADAAACDVPLEELMRAVKTHLLDQTFEMLEQAATTPAYRRIDELYGQVLRAGIEGWAAQLAESGSDS